MLRNFYISLFFIIFAARNINNMANPICLSPLKFYDSPDKQEFHKSYAYGHISPLITKANTISPFQFVIPDGSSISYVRVYKVDGKSYIDVTQQMKDAGLSITTVNSYKLVIYHPANFPIPDLKHEGEYYLAIRLNTGVWYYSEVFCYTNQLDDCLEIEYWNKTGDFSLKNGLIAFQDDFRFKLYLKSELGKPEYNFEEEATKRLGYSFIESQVSKKVYRFNTVIPEYLCDAMRLIRLCSNKTLTSKGETYDMLSFDMEVDWQQQGDLASVTCEFETDNVLVSLGGFVPEELGGDFRNAHYNDDFDNQ